MNTAQLASQRIQTDQSLHICNVQNKPSSRHLAFAKFYLQPGNCSKASQDILDSMQNELMYKVTLLLTALISRNQLKGKQQGRWHIRTQSLEKVTLHAYQMPDYTQSLFTNSGINLRPNSSLSQDADYNR